jgi:hypothetical protein
MLYILSWLDLNQRWFILSFMACLFVEWYAGKCLPFLH